MLRFKQKKVWD